jgi:hypothetical protein
LPAQVVVVFSWHFALPLVFDMHPRPHGISLGRQWLVQYSPGCRGEVRDSIDPDGPDDPDEPDGPEEPAGFCCVCCASNTSPPAGAASGHDAAAARTGMLSRANNNASKRIKDSHSSRATAAG